MIKVIACFDKVSGPDAVGDYRITFSMNESINQGEFNPMAIKKGTQFIIHLIDAEQGEQEDDFREETPEEKRQRLYKQFHAQITEVAKFEGMDQIELKEEIKQDLKERGIIKESTKELTDEQLATEITKLKVRVL